ncbi:hypothetical protein EJ04DRAFT_507205 [Polyplosphaeria fusca]|uniref:Uncharacterized protein n=1 Tax=Polyplosphaeria fusca TaxID=682080 RepID=A0A9P4V658_9PLEO|nr:hypothetical protein EJ04DRAFT_507205 [Polyplosphaeria fusca]
MSGAGENRWRRSGQANRQNQDRSSGTNTPTRDGGRQSVSGNAWTGKNKAVGGGDRAVAQPASAPPEQHAPVKEFNANEVKEFLKKRYLESIADQPSVYHKVQGDSVAKRSSGAWGSRGNMSHQMPGGQDFFFQLKKQLQNFEQGKTA